MSQRFLPIWRPEKCWKTIDQDSLFIFTVNVLYLFCILHLGVKMLWVLPYLPKLAKCQSQYWQISNINIILFSEISLSIPIIPLLRMFFYCLYDFSRAVVSYYHDHSAACKIINQQRSNVAFAYKNWNFLFHDGQEEYLARVRWEDCSFLGLMQHSPANETSLLLVID